LTSVWARRRDAAEPLAHAYCAEIADDPASLISQVDAVAFAVPPAVQAELALQAVKAGKHVILEKPIGSTVDEAERLAGAIADAGVASLVALVRRFAPETVEWLAGLRSVGGWVGGNAQWMSGALLSDDYANSAWRHENGALLDIGPHVIDLMDAALGEITDVVAATVSDTGLWQLILRHEGGATSTVSLCLSLPLQPAFADLTVFGVNGARTLTNRDTPALECFTNLLDDFVAMVHSGTTAHECDVRRGLHLQRIIDLARSKAGA